MQGYSDSDHSKVIYGVGDLSKKEGIESPLKFKDGKEESFHKYYDKNDNDNWFNRRSGQWGRREILTNQIRRYNIWWRNWNILTTRVRERRSFDSRSG